MNTTRTAPTMLRRQDLAVMGQILLAGYQAGERISPTHCPSLTTALRAGLVAAPDLLPAIADDVALVFGVRVDQIAICGVTPAVVAVAFAASTVRGGRAQALPGGGSDPLYLLWPGGYEHFSIAGRVMAHLNEAVSAMLNGDWRGAIEPLQHAGQESANLRAQDVPLVRRALAGNLTLAVAFSRGEAPLLPRWS